MEVRAALLNRAGFRIATIALAGEKEVSRDAIIAAAELPAAPHFCSSMSKPPARDSRAIHGSRKRPVLKLYPDRLRIDIRERQAFALWQRDGAISVIAVDGSSFNPQLMSVLPISHLSSARARKPVRRIFSPCSTAYPQIRRADLLRC